MNICVSFLCQCRVVRICSFHNPNNFHIYAISIACKCFESPFWNPLKLVLIIFCLRLNWVMQLRATSFTHFVRLEMRWNSLYATNLFLIVLSLHPTIVFTPIHIQTNLYPMCQFRFEMDWKLAVYVSFPPVDIHIKEVNS